MSSLALATGAFTGTPSVAAAIPVTAALGGTRFPGYSLTLDGYQLATFSELLSLELGAELLEFVESDIIVRPVPRLKPPIVVLRRPQPTTTDNIWAWHQLLRQGDLATARRDVTLNLLNEDAQPVVRYVLSNALVIAIGVTPVPNRGPLTLYQTVTISCEELVQINP